MLLLQKKKYFKMMANAQVWQEMPLGCVPDRCVPERKVSEIPSIGQCIPWKMGPLNDASLRRRIPDRRIVQGTHYPLHALSKGSKKSQTERSGTHCSGIYIVPSLNKNRSPVIYNYTNTYIHKNRPGSSYMDAATSSLAQKGHSWRLFIIDWNLAIHIWKASQPPLNIECSLFIDLTLE